MVEFLPRVGQKVDFKILFGNHAGSYSTYVDHVDARSITLAQPTIGGIPIPLGAGHAVRLEYTQTGARVSYNTRVMGTIMGNVPEVKVQVPDRSEVERIQLRDFVRQECTLPFTSRILFAPDAEENPRPDVEIPGRTKDISGSGSMISCLEPYPPLTQLELKIDIGGSLLIVVAEVIRAVTQINDKEWWVAVRFLNISERDREVIIRFIFNLQRDLRAKGLLGR